MKKLILYLILLFAFSSNSFAQGIPFPGGGVVKASSGGATYGVGDTFSERFTTTPGTDETWGTPTEQGGADWNPDATTISGTGFVGEHLAVGGTTNWEARNTADMGSALSSAYFRFYIQVISESLNDGDVINVFSIDADGQDNFTTTYMAIVIRQVATNQLHLYCNWRGSSGFTTGSTTYNITAGTTYKVEGKVVDSGDGDIGEWKVDGVVIGTRSGALWTGAAMQHINLGASYIPRAASIAIDTLDVDSTGYLTDTP